MHSHMNKTWDMRCDEMQRASAGVRTTASQAIMHPLLAGTTREAGRGEI